MLHKREKTSLRRADIHRGPCDPGFSEEDTFFHTLWYTVIMCTQLASSALALIPSFILVAACPF